MAKSIRSKAKRDFRAKKRSDGIYAATEAARLNRLNAKLSAVAAKDAEGDVLLEDLKGKEDDMPGWFWFAIAGVLDVDDITVESMTRLAETCEGLEVHGRQGYVGAIEMKRHRPFFNPVLDEF